MPGSGGGVGCTDRRGDGMDPYEATRIVYGRVQALEPEVGSKIMLHLLLQEHGEQEMLRLALGSDALVQAMVGKAKKELGLSSLGSLGEDIVPGAGGLRGGGGGVREQQQQQQQQQARPAPLYIPDHDFGSFSNVLSSPSLHEVKLAAALQQQQQQHSHSHSHTHEQQQLFLHDQLPLHDHLALLSDAVEQSSLRGAGMYAAVAAASDHFYPETYAFLNSSKELLHSRSSSSRASPVVDNINIINNNGSSPPDFGPALAWKPCLYFARGYCKHGSNCRFLHGPMRESSGSPASSNGNGGRELRVDDNGMAPGSLERLEIELQELLRGRRAPVSIASLPQLYYERFGKTLQAEGYLTESQRHGKAGYSLTKLLARLKNTVTLIDRPHGQHAVVLAEDAHRFTAYRSDHRGEDLSGINPSSRQIYLTFPAESTFTEEDVTSHFRAYGPVQDVRIPYQQKRMFGFVTFVYSETVKAILSEGNPHYICGARVLVKPYREKGKHGDRKYSERADHARFVQSRSIDGKDFDFHAVTKFYEEEEAFTRRLEEEEQVLELERRRLAELQLADVQRRRAEAEATMAVVAAQNRVLANAGFSADDLGLTSEGLSQFHPSNSFGYLLDVLDGGDQGDDSDQTTEVFGSKSSGNGNGHNLPDSPFTSPLGTSKQKVFSLPEKMKSLSLQGSQVGHTAAIAAAHSLTCCICLEYAGDTVQLECSHTFCVQCVLKVMHVGSEECPVCGQGIGNHETKVTQNRDLLQWSQTAGTRQQLW